MLRISPSATTPTPPHSGWPLFDTAATRAIEHQAATGLPAHGLMQRAGLGVARLARALSPHARRIWIACGPGNNGGDGLQAAAWLKKGLEPGLSSTCRIMVSCVHERDRMPADARAAWDAAHAAGVQWTQHMPADMGPQDLCIDALLGIGLRPPGADRPVDEGGRLLALLRSTQACASPVLCVDVASGLDADTGQYLPGFAPLAAPASPRHTLALLTLQPGLFTGHGRDACGEIWWDPLGTGLDTRLENGETSAGTSPCAHLFNPPTAAPRPHASHKGSFGDVAILGGEGMGQRGLSMAGAAWLAALAALHGGAGRVMLALLDAPEIPAGPGQAIAPWPEIMLRSPAAQDWRSATVVCGCGGGMAVRPWLPQVLDQAPRLVLDADALNAVAEDSALARTLGERRRRGLDTVLTPHPLEAARLLHTDTSQVQAGRLQAAQELARRFDCTVLLKGSGSVIAAPRGRADTRPYCWINPTGNARLSTGGTGDVLAGLIAALWAQGLAPPLAAAWGAHRHGAVADQWPPQRPFSASALAIQLG